MVAFGLILALIGIGGSVLLCWLALQSTSAVTLQGASITVSVLPITVYVTAVGLILVIWLGWRLMVLGSRRRRSQREEIERLRSTSAQAERQAAAAQAKTPGEGPGTGSGMAGGTGGGGPASVEAAPNRPAGAPAGAEAPARPDSPARTAERHVRGPMD